MPRIEKKITHTTDDGIKCVYLGKLHSIDDKPAWNFPNGNQYWFRNGKMHREGDKPAVITSKTSMWLKDGIYHRNNDLPALVYTSGHKEWYINGERHREYGPAVVKAGGETEFWINDKQVKD